jgi:hypothetical protein
MFEKPRPATNVSVQTNLNFTAALLTKTGAVCADALPICGGCAVISKVHKILNIN